VSGATNAEAIKPRGKPGNDYDDLVGWAADGAELINEQAGHMWQRVETMRDLSLASAKYDKIVAYTIAPYTT